MATDQADEAVEAWVQKVLASSQVVERVRAVLPLLQWLQSPWEQFWREHVECADEASLGKDELALLERWATGQHGAAEDMRTAAFNARKLADSVASEDAVHGEDAGGVALLFTALLTLALLEALGEPDEEITFVDTVTNTPSLVMAYPSLAEAFLEDSVKNA